MKYAQHVSELVGGTPLVRLSSVTTGLTATILAKVEYLNPGGSVKDRIALRMHAEAGSSLDELAEAFDVEHIAEHLYTKGQPDPDLVIRTSGEQRLGGFLLWQSTHSEFYFCDAYWPDFRRVDFLRAVRAYGQRERRLGR